MYKIDRYEEIWRHGKIDSYKSMVWWWSPLDTLIMLEWIDR